MRRSAMCACLLAVFAICAPASAMAQQSASLSGYWTDYLERTLGSAPAGYAFAIRDGDETIVRGVGFERLPRDGRGGVAMEADGVVHLASISKTITALALLHLLEDRRIDLDAPFWPHVRRAFRELTPGAGVDQITIAQVLAHRSGLPSMEINPPMMTNLASQLARDTAAEPGSAFVYSNLNYTIARVLIEAISGARYEDYVRRVVLEPAGAGRMSLRPPLGRSFAHRVGDAESTAFEQDFTEDAGGYGWYGSARDVAAIFARFAAGGYVSGELRARMVRDRLGIYAFELANGTGYSSDGHWNLADGRGSKTAVVVFPGEVVVALVMNTVWDGNLVGVLNDGYRQNVPALLAVEPVRTPSPLVRVTVPWHARDVRCALNGEEPHAGSERYRAPLAFSDAQELRCAGFYRGRRTTHIARIARASQ